MFSRWYKPQFSKTTPKSISLLLLGLVVSLLLVACAETPTLGPASTLAPLNATPSPVPASPLPVYNSGVLGATGVAATLNGGGSTRLDAIYKGWLPEYAKVAPAVKLNYQSTNSGNGQNGFLGTPIARGSYAFDPISPLDFAGSDFPYNGEQLVGSRNRGEIVHLPIMLGGVAIAYRLDGFSGQLRLSGPTIAEIFLGKITNWSDAKITADNEGKALPNKPILVAIRSRTFKGSGTSEVFSRYMALVSPEIRGNPKLIGGQIDWQVNSPPQLEGENGAAVAKIIKDRDGAIGYLDLEQATGEKLSFASIRNQTGRYILPTRESLTAAAQGASVPDDFRIFLVNAEGEYAYPMVGFTWVLAWKDFSKIPGATPEKAQALGNFLWWGWHEGQKLLPNDFAPLPASLITRLEDRFLNQDETKVFLFNGKRLFSPPK